MKPTAKNFIMSRHTITLEALRNSIRAYGQLTPVFILGGLVVDGTRRQQIMRELGRTPNVVTLHTHKEAARILWVTHPVQAWQEHGRDFDKLSDAAEFFNVCSSDIARIRSLLKPPKAALDDLGAWRARYRIRYQRAQNYLSKVRQGLTPLTLGGIESALRISPTQR